MKKHTGPNEGRDPRHCMKSDTKGKRRVGWRLLALLWVWAVCVFLVLDLFKNIPELDRVRPDSDFYRSLRFAAHDLAGEEYTENDAFGRAKNPAGRKPRQPPPKYRGTEFEWRIREGYVDLATELRRIDKLGKRERLRLLHSVRRTPNTDLAPVLAEIADRVPTDPASLGNYAYASAAVLRALVAEQFKKNRTPPSSSIRLA